MLDTSYPYSYVFCVHVMEIGSDGMFFILKIESNRILFNFENQI